jgi:hypothetical protein
MIEELPANTKVSIIVDDRTHLLDAIAIGHGIFFPKQLYRKIASWHPRQKFYGSK